MRDSGEAAWEVDAAWRALLMAHATLLRRLGAALHEAPAGRQPLLPLEWYDALLALAESPGGRMRLGELAEAALLSRSGLTRLVDRLVAAGLARRERAAGDRRGSYAVITPEGRRAMARTLPAYEAALDRELGARLAPGEAKRLAQLLWKLADRSQLGRRPVTLTVSARGRAT